MQWLANLIRRARLRGLREGAVQVVRAEALEHDAQDDCERWQDYGFAGNPGDGQGLRLAWGGHTIVLRMDRIAERPQLSAYEVALWHKEGHRITLKADGVIEIDGAVLRVTATDSVAITAPTTTVTGNLAVTGTISAHTVSASSSLLAAGAQVVHHKHGNVTNGDGETNVLS